MSDVKERCTMGGGRCVMGDDNDVQWVVMKKDKVVNAHWLISLHLMIVITPGWTPASLASPTPTPVPIPTNPMALPPRVFRNDPLAGTGQEQEQEPNAGQQRQHPILNANINNNNNNNNNNNSNNNNNNNRQENMDIDQQLNPLQLDWSLVFY